VFDGGINNFSFKFKNRKLQHLSQSDKSRSIRSILHNFFPKIPIEMLSIVCLISMVFWLVHGVSFPGFIAKKIDICARFEVHLSLRVPPLVVSQSSGIFWEKTISTHMTMVVQSEPVDNLSFFCEFFLA